MAGRDIVSAEGHVSNRNDHLELIRRLIRQNSAVYGVFKFTVLTPHNDSTDTESWANRQTGKITTSARKTLQLAAPAEGSDITFLTWSEARVQSE